MRNIYLIILFLAYFVNVNAQNGWQSYSIPSPGGNGFSFGDANTGMVVYQHKYYRTTNGAISWQTHITPDTSSTLFYGGIYFLDNLTGWISGGSTVSPIPYNFIHKTTDGGLTWGPRMGVYTIQDIQFLNPNTGYLATGDVPMYVTQGYLSKTTNGGTNWNSLLSDYFIYKSISFINSETGWVYGYFGDDVGQHIDKFLKTTNGGLNWITLLYDSVGIGHQPFGDMQFFDINTGYLMNVKLHKTTNGGVNWVLLDTNAFSGNYVRNYFFLNKDTGWVTTGPLKSIFRTNDGGNNWSLQYTAQSNIIGKIYFVNSLTGWVQINNTTILKTTTGGVTAISNVSTEIPDKFSLHQNYPNPFNPNTSIKFEIPSSVRGEKVKLSVYDIAGKEVGVFVNSELQSGVYEYNFDGSRLGSGVYFYKLQSGDFIQTRRMVLVK
jgi:photosystem II stability/assembly factor-like uncharacterized protein